ncbi:MAG: SIS domain-containing protein [Alphaproteobacteria bacterium]|nr:SIS domain-containing protein [Alphaproteobacteria bacterium]
MTTTARIRAILDAEAKAIRSITVDDTYARALDAMATCSGKIITVGMGKAGYVARRFAATLASTATPAFFVHPSEAAHGDLGHVEDGDCILAFSTSGKTTEVVEFIDMARHLNPSGVVIGITSHPDSSLRDRADIVLDMGVIEEPCPLGLTPTASIAAMSAIADALTLTLMERKGVTREQYGVRHHGGYLGRKARTDNV